MENPTKSNINHTTETTTAKPDSVSTAPEVLPTPTLPTAPLVKNAGYPLRIPNPSLPKPAVSVRVVCIKLF